MLPLQQTPKELACNPVYQLDFRQLRPPRTDGELARFAQVAWWTLATLSVPFALTLYVLFERHALDMMFAMLLLANLASTLAADAYVIVLTVSRVSHHIQSGQWDDLRLTTLHTQEILSAKYTIALVRGRRLLPVQRAFRLLPLLALAIIVAANHTIGDGFFLRQFARNTQVYGASYLLLALALPPIALYAVLYEPLWQMKASAALGIIVPYLVRVPIFAALGAFALLLALRLAELALLAMVGSGLFWLLVTHNLIAFCTIGPLLTVLPYLLYTFHEASYAGLCRAAAWLMQRG
jgi:hypothetical protein